MSACISSQGEYSSHEPDPDHYCRLCGAFDEAAVLAERDAARAEVAALRERVEAVLRFRSIDGVRKVPAEARDLIRAALTEAAPDQTGGA